MATLHTLIVPLILAVTGVQPPQAGQPVSTTPSTPPTGPAAPTGSAAPASTRDDSAAEKLGWRLAVQAWTFRDRTAFEAIDAARALGIKYIEFYPGQKLSPDRPDDKVGHDMSKEAQEALKAKLAAAGVKLVNYGVVNPTKDKDATKKIFQFAKDMGIETVTCEPEADAWDAVEEDCYLFQVNAACHDHPKPSRYWDPKTVQKAIERRGQRVGVCADVGHWKRSGLVPVECLQRLRGRILCLHFKDIKAPEGKEIKDGVDQPWGTGDCDAKGILEELHRQGFRGVISLEYESGSGAELEANAKKCVEFFDKTAAAILKGDE
jgi:sugar phosphate isomerase/epimerase